MSSRTTVKESREHLRAIVTAGVGAESRIVEIVSKGDLNFMISWLLGSDPHRPSKRSKNILLTIEREALDKYVRATTSRRLLADARLHRCLADLLAKHEPDHDAPLGCEAPSVHWSIGPETLMG